MFEVTEVFSTIYLIWPRGGNTMPAAYVDKQRIGRSRDHLKYFRDGAVPGCRLSGFLEYSGHNNPLFDDFLDFGGRLSSFLKLLGRNASFKAFDYCHSSQRALSGHPAIPCG